MHVHLAGESDLSILGLFAHATIAYCSLSSKSLVLILERLMIAEVCTSVPGISLRADKASNVQLPFR